MQYTKGPCKNCQRPTNNPIFCSRSCSTAYNNSKQPKIKLSKFCLTCGKPIRSQKTYCNQKCSPNFNDYDTITIQELRAAAKYQVNAYIRNIARRVYRNSNKPKRCCNCGYDKHYEVCHIRAINSFPLDTLISVVNNIDNLIGLCPNCHWELDHDLLQLK